VKRNRSTRTNRIASQVLLAAFALWQVGALVHLTHDTHVILADGSVADVDDHTGERHRESEGCAPRDGCCPVLSQLTTANTMASQDVIAVLVDLAESARAEFRYEDVVPSQIDLFRLSPSNSPPASS